MFDRRGKRFKAIEPGDRWRCIRCGHCCTQDFETTWVDFVGGVEDHETGRVFCRNLAQKGEFNFCTLYNERPNACQAFPFSLRKMDYEGYNLVIYLRCPGYGHGEEVNIRKQIEKSVQSARNEFKVGINIDYSLFDKDSSVGLKRYELKALSKSNTIS